MKTKSLKQSVGEGLARKFEKLPDDKTIEKRNDKWLKREIDYEGK